MRKNRLIALIGTLTMAAAGLAAVSAGVSNKKADSVSAATSATIKGTFDSWGSGVSMTNSGGWWSGSVTLNANAEFKVVLGSDWIGANFNGYEGGNILGEGFTYTGTGSVVNGGGSDNNFKVTTGGVYNIEIVDSINSYGKAGYGFKVTRTSGTPSSNKITYYLYDVDSLGWQAKAHYWNDGGIYDGTTWPGTEMTNLGNGLWSIQISESFDRVIFNNGLDGDVNKTANHTLYTTDSTKRCFDLWKSYTGQEGNSTRNGQWNTNGAPYFVRYDITGATGTAPENVTPRVNDSTKPTAAAGTTFEKSGFNFKGWTTTSGGSTVDYAVGATISSSTPGQVITLYPVWEQKAAEQYTVAFNNNGGSGSMDPITTNVGSTTSVPPCTFTAPNGMKFKEWNSAQNGSGDTYDSTHPVPSQASGTTKTIYAIWEDFNPHNGRWIEFSTKGSSSQVDRIAMDYSNNEWSVDAQLYEGDEFKIVYYGSEVKSDERGYSDLQPGAQNFNQIVVGTSDAMKVNVHDSSKTSNDVYSGTYHITFNDGYTEFKSFIQKIQYTVTYHANNGTAEADRYIHPEVGSKFTTESYTVASFTPPTGKVFKGWNTASGGSGTSYNVNDQVEGSQYFNQTTNFELYAMWGDPVADGMYLRGSFDWTAQGQVHMDADSTVENQFVAKGIKLEDGHSVKAVGYSSNYESWIDATSAGVPTETGYSASVDNTNAKITGNRGVFNVYVKTSDGSYNFYPLRVTYDANGGEGTMTDSFPTESGYVATVSTNTFTHSAKLTFGGWNTASDGTGTWYNEGGSINFSSLTEDVKLYAIWNQIVTLNDNKGHGGVGYIEATPGKTIPDLSTLPERTGYSFTGYWTNNDGTGTQYYDENGNGLVTFDGSVSTLYAGWSIHTNTVSFNLNGAPDSLQPEPVDLDYGECLGDQYPDLTNKWAGHTFDGWYYEDITPAMKIEATTPDTIDDDIELVAHWSDDNPTITINVVGSSYGSVTVNGEPYQDSFTVPYNSEYIVDDSGFIMIGDDYEIVAEAGDGSPEFEFTFDGWSGIDESGNFTEDTIITATFSSDYIDYMLAYYFDDGEPQGTYSPEGSEYHYHDEITLPTTVLKDGYEFKGFYDNEDFEGDPISGSFLLEDDTAIYAKFDILTYNVTLDPGDGEGGSVSPVSYQISDSPQTITITDPVLEGYTPSYTLTTAPDGVTIDGNTITIPANTIGNIAVSTTWTITPETEVARFIAYFNEKMAVCDKDGKTDEEALATAWDSLYKKNGENNYDIYSDSTGTVISNAAKSMLASAKADPEGTDLQKFAFAYNYICGKYNLEDFAGRNPVVNSASRLFSVSNVSTSTWIIAAVAIVGIAAVGVFFIYRKRKEN